MTTFKGTIEIEAIDIPTMYRMSEHDYRKFLENGELFGLIIMMSCDRPPQNTR